jgi:WD40 repeat protein
MHVVKYSPQGETFASAGRDKMIRVWPKEGGLPIEIRGDGRNVRSLCWTKDGAHIFSGSTDGTIRKWRSIDGGEVAVLHGHTSIVASLCLTLDERYLVSASVDFSVRIWDLKTDQPEQVGDPLWHDDELRALAIFPDGNYFASAGLDHKIYIWSLEAALKHARDQVRVHIAVVILFSNRPCIMHSPTRNSRQVIPISLLHCISFLHQGLAASPRDVH